MRMRVVKHRDWSGALLQILGVCRLSKPMTHLIGDSFANLCIAEPCFN
jgi:hypothetical protein